MSTLEINACRMIEKDVGVSRGQTQMGSRKITFISGKPMIFVFLHHVVAI